MAEQSNQQQTTQQQTMIFAKDSGVDFHNDQSWSQQHMDVVFPLIVFGLGLFQFVLRKWIAPVPYDIIFELNDRFAAQGLIFHPGFGVFLMIAGGLMLILFHLNVIF